MSIENYTSVALIGFSHDLQQYNDVACGISNRPKETVVDIDVAGAEIQLAAVEYVEDLFKCYRLAENTSRVHDYMDSQLNINIKMRELFWWIG
ncbi:G2/mitotic-specific cyclin S13-6 [Thalictrum thalictroides]|uniref:G2/mitotic-specific cyclin S13-6 n=1 Tax=Thalictrum thalictroides TaxID=46969 RepID=A0A7J6VZ55_THATH|nr:G2/mitotic-specific cyclin S13-6 [Thalictrum thalictroides]